jgi:hypothetical protein
MKRCTNGLPGATKRLGAKVALRGLAASESWVRADTHDGPEQIAPLQRPDTCGRAIHFGTKTAYIERGGSFGQIAETDGRQASCRSWFPVAVTTKAPEEEKKRSGAFPVIF